MRNKILFQYALNSSCGWVGRDYGGFVFTVFDNGEVQYVELIFDKIVKDVKRFKCDISMIKELNAFLEKNLAEISKLNVLDNGSYDGAFNIFTFSDKEISALNIGRNNLNEIKKNNPEYYNEHYNNMIQENLVLDYFEEICKILKEYQIELSLHNVKLPLKEYF